MTDEQKKQLLAQLQELKAEREALDRPEPREEDRSLTQAALQGVGKTLDYAGGLSRAGLAQLAAWKSGKELIKPGEIQEALKFKRPFPTTADYLERAGVPETGKLSDLLPEALVEDKPGSWFKMTRGGDFDLTGRGSIGAAGDLLIDPLNLLSFGGGGVAKKVVQSIPKATKPLTRGEKVAQAVTAPFRAAERSILAIPEKATELGYRYAPRATEAAVAAAKFPSRMIEKAGEALEESGMRKILDHAEGRKKGTTMDTFRRYGITGKAKDMWKAGDEAQNLIGAELDQIARGASRAQANVPRAMREFANELQQAVADGEMSIESARALAEWAQKSFLGLGSDVAPRTMVGFKRQTYREIPHGQSYVGNAWERGSPRASDIEVRLEKALAEGFDTEAKRAIEAASGPQAAERFSQFNVDYGNLASAERPLRGMSSAEKGYFPMDAWDAAILLGGQAGGQAGMAGAGLAGKKAYDWLLNNPASKRRVGATMRELGANPLLGSAVDTATRRSLVDAFLEEARDYEQEKDRSKR